MHKMNIGNMNSFWFILCYLQPNHSQMNKAGELKLFWCSLEIQNYLLFFSATIIPFLMKFACALTIL